MSIFLFPFLLWSLYFIVPGTRLATGAILLSKDRLVAFFALLGFILVYHAVVFSVPFVIATGRSVGQADMFIYTFVIAIGTAMTLGNGMRKTFEECQQRKAAYVGAVMYLSAGLTPVSWFTFSESLRRAMSIKWMY